MINIALGLGANLGNRLENLRKAVDYLLSANVISNITISSLYETAPLVPENAPSNWNKTFYNIVIKGATNYKPLQLLQKIKEIETILGRKKRLKWAPREIDIDILVYAEEYIEISVGSMSLVIPHIDLLNRDFFLVPLAELWPDWKYPIEGIFMHKSALTLINNFTGSKNIINITPFPKINT
ncbi:2-amino-4-hydroxy-6- hydroxymethyldihydropteridine pyrophosphokinase [Rickettsiales bacterium Ac37b]|nr:2-amino-4-hydroxy-6- hydroxymethyldihydropteridine pyrophosphokinase [Rickettsiales bacterium Ac37b]